MWVSECEVLDHVPNHTTEQATYDHGRNIDTGWELKSKGDYCE